MKAFELVEEIKKAMMETGMGSRDILGLDTSTGDVYDILKVEFDSIADCFFVSFAFGDTVDNEQG